MPDDDEPKNQTNNQTSDSSPKADQDESGFEPPPGLGPDYIQRIAVDRKEKRKQ